MALPLPDGLMYLLPTGSSMRDLPPWYGTLTTPARWGNTPIREGRTWAMDNGVFTGAFDPERFLRTLARLEEHRSTCAFVAAPDVIGDAKATLAEWPAWSRAIHEHGYPVALVAQDGLTPERIPTDADALFIGGTDAWRNSRAIAALVHAARARGLWIHVGRVNSLKRLRRFALLGAHSADGTHSAFAGVPATVRRFDTVLAQPPLWSATALAAVHGSARERTPIGGPPCPTPSHPNPTWSSPAT